MAGYIGTRAGRDLNTPMTQGLQALPEPKPKRFALNYHLLSVVADGGRIRLQTWVDDGEPVPSLIEVWPTADWHEREAYDMLGINIIGPSEPEADPDGRRLGRAPAAQGLPDRRRAGAVLGGGVMAVAPTVPGSPRGDRADLRGHAHPAPDAERPDDVAGAARRPAT